MYKEYRLRERDIPVQSSSSIDWINFLHLGENDLNNLLLLIFLLSSVNVGNDLSLVLFDTIEICALQTNEAKFIKWAILWQGIY